MLWSISVLVGVWARATSICVNAITYSSVSADADQNPQDSSSRQPQAAMPQVCVAAAKQQARVSMAQQSEFEDGPKGDFPKAIHDTSDDISNIFAPPASAHELLQDIVEDPLACPLLDDDVDILRPEYFLKGFENTRAKRL